jgi:hypothetical protein
MCELEKQTPVDQQTHPALDLLAARPEIFAQQGSVDASWRRRANKTYGPYYRLRYRDGRSSRSVYLGPAGPLVDRVRHVLQSLQTPLRHRRAMLQLRRQVRDALRLDRRHVDARLRSLGLRLKGFEVRGWRTSPLRALARLATAATAPSFSGAAAKPASTDRERSLMPQPLVPQKGPLASLQIKPFRLPRARRLRYMPKGRARKRLRNNRPKIPRLPQARVLAILDARDRVSHKPRR